MIDLDDPRARGAVRLLSVSVAAVACAALVRAPLPAITLCAIAIVSAGAVTGLAEAPDRRPRDRRQSVAASTLVVLRILGYLVALPTTWRMLDAMADLGHVTGSPWRWVPLLLGSLVFAIGHRVGAERSRAEVAR